MATDVDIDLLRAFLAVVDGGSFTTAARTLNRTQAAVSMQIKRLEETVGGLLLDRSSRRVELTRRGEALAGYARRMVMLNDEALATLREDALGGIVRLEAIEDYAVHSLPPLLAGFMSAHPNVAVEMETGFTPSLIDRLGETFDVVLTMHPSGAGRGEVLRRERAVWAGSRQHAVHEQAVLPLALHPAGCQFRQAALTSLDRAKRPWRLTYVCQSHGALEAAVLTGLGVTVTKSGTLPRGLAVFGRAEGLPSLPSFEISLHRKRRNMSRAAIALADHLAAALNDGSF
jgi:DNA-binding transcriptional LysR family regulator